MLKPLTCSAQARQPCSNNWLLRRWPSLCMPQTCRLVLLEGLIHSARSWRSSAETWERIDRWLRYRLVMRGSKPLGLGEVWLRRAVTPLAGKAESGKVEWQLWLLCFTALLFVASWADQPGLSTFQVLFPHWNMAAKKAEASFLFHAKFSLPSCSFTSPRQYSRWKKLHPWRKYRKVEECCMKRFNCPKFCSFLGFLRSSEGNCSF